MKGEFCEKFDTSDKIKGILLIFIYLLISNIPVEWFNRIDSNNFIKDNSQFVGYFMLFLVMIFFFGNRLIQTTKGVKLKKAGEILLAWLAVVASTVILAIVKEYVFKIHNQNEIDLANARINGSVFLSAITVILIGPIFEEVLFRFVIFRTLREHDVIVAHVVTTLLFALNHVYKNIPNDRAQHFNVLIYIPLGVGTSMLYERNRNLFYPIALHVAVNWFAF